MSDTTWFANLKVGDEVAVVSRWMGVSILSVERITKTLIVLTDGQKFNIVSGRAPGTGYSKNSIKPVTQEIRAGVEGRNIRNTLAMIAKDPDVTLGQLRMLRDAWYAAQVVQA